MNIDEAIIELTVLEHRLRKNLLAESATATLETAKAQLQLLKNSDPDAPWSFEIPREQPLEFRPTRSINYSLMIDIFGQFSELLNGEPSSAHSITVRVWGLKKSCWFDSDLDATQLEKIISEGLRRRVMLRFRFDYAQPSLDEPWFHMQFGGQQTGQEYFRMPDNFGVPRFGYYPMNLLMTCEFVVRHFFPEEYDMVANEPSWRRALAIAQRAYLARFVTRIEDFDLEENHSFLQHCWDQ